MCLANATVFFPLFFVCFCLLEGERSHQVTAGLMSRYLHQEKRTRQQETHAHTKKKPAAEDVRTRRLRKRKRNASVLEVA